MTAKTKKAKKFETHQSVLAALAPLHTAIFDRLVSGRTAQAKAVYKRLEAHGWNLREAFPRPTGFESKLNYHRMMAEHQTALKLTVRNDEAVKLAAKEMGCSPFSVNAPQIVDPFAPEVLGERIRVESEADAKAMLASYANKMTAKFSEHCPEERIVTTTYHGSGDPWSWSTLTSVFESGKSAVLKTQMIVNVSPLGKLFNQFPTRLASYE